MFLYGGSKKTILNFLIFSLEVDKVFITDKESPLITFTLSIARVSKFLFIIFIARLLLSIIIAEFAYLDMPSIVNAPEPPNKSRIFPSIIFSPSTL